MKELPEVTVTPEMIDAGAAVVCEWFPFDGERLAISAVEARALALAVLETALSRAGP
jgi:hypothetical protein